jgi:NAD(P)-dependent dehydrogenase (short-subunit alcohol dehydrogenase family)
MGRAHSTSLQYREAAGRSLLRIYNRLAGFLPGRTGEDLDPESLLAAARAATGLADFGDPGFREPLHRLIDSIQRQAQLTPFGRAVMRGRLLSMLSNRLRIEALYQDARVQPALAAQTVQRPIFIIGLQRTGTTLLHRLLAADPQARALLSWEALHPAPLPGEGQHGSFKRRRLARLAELGLRAVAPEFFAIHPVQADAPEEDVLLLDHAFTSQAPEATLHVPAYAAWLETQDLVPSYQYLLRTLKLLGWQRPGDFWVLKTPHHLEYVDALRTVFPDAVLVQTHRDPQATLGSFCSMVTHARRMFSDAVDPREVGRHWLRKVRRMIDRSLAARAAGAEAAVVDVSYYDLLRDPLAEVRRIYAHAGRPLTPAAEAAMQRVLAEQTQHRHGRHTYRSRDFGLSPARIEETFADYRARFAIPRERGPADDDLHAQAGASGVGHANPVTAMVTGVLDLWTQRGTLLPVGPEQSLAGRTAVVTGASSGLGKAVAIDLLRRGARVLLPLRGGIPQAGQDIAAQSGSRALEMLPVDLCDLDSVAALADALRARGETVDLLVCNAGLMPARAVRTRQGFEAMFAVHYLANHLLIRLLLASGVLPNSVYADNGRSGTAIPRIVLVTSETHRSCPGLDFAHLGEFVDYGLTDGVARYGCSKLAQTTFASELARRLTTAHGPTVAVHSLCPGPVDSRLAREAPASLQPILQPVMRTFFRRPDVAAAPVIYLAAAPELAGETGWYLHLMRHKTPSPAALDPGNGDRLWARGEALLAPWLDAATRARGERRPL